MNDELRERDMAIGSKENERRKNERRKKKGVGFDDMKKGMRASLLVYGLCVLCYVYLMRTIFLVSINLFENIL